MTTAILVTTYNRPKALERSLPQIAALGAPVLVVDDGSKEHEQAYVNGSVCDDLEIKYLYVPKNRGLAATMNIGLSYWLADKSVDWISYFQDDVDVHPKTLEILSRLGKHNPILTGHDAWEHPSHQEAVIDGIHVKHKWAVRATHIHASAAFWREFLPIPTNELGTPKRRGENERGIGSNADWWIVRDSPRSCKKTNRPILCVPGLVRTFLYRAADSCWNADSGKRDEPPLRSDL